ncbi:hypothetical protein TIFTF001_039796 [Ficus carica]|uniref:Uncharacterized protein n=1 Tax=Ficus carica TaxID=3494 RepID=A0AA88CH60_FICCA|nr:hypothetical protein TIFTF001_039796 [Ficus carica]
MKITRKIGTSNWTSITNSWGDIGMIVVEFPFEDDQENHIIFQMTSIVDIETYWESCKSWLVCVLGYLGKAEWWVWRGDDTEGIYEKIIWEIMVEGGGGGGHVCMCNHEKEWDWAVDVSSNEIYSWPRQKVRDDTVISFNMSNIKEFLPGSDVQSSGIRTSRSLA